MSRIPPPSLVWIGPLFKLLSRGPRFEADTLDALLCAGLTAQHAQQLLDAFRDTTSPESPGPHAAPTDLESGGRLTSGSFRALMTECMSVLTASETETAPVDRLVTGFGMGMLKDFEKRCTARGDFMVAAEARHQAQRLRELAEVRHVEHMNVRQSNERSGVQEAHVMEAVEFNRAWGRNMEEFEQRATLIVQASPAIFIRVKPRFTHTHRHTHTQLIFQKIKTDHPRTQHEHIKEHTHVNASMSPTERAGF